MLAEASKKFVACFDPNFAYLVDGFSRVTQTTNPFFNKTIKKRA
jgi:hypothetical protein